MRIRTSLLFYKCTQFNNEDMHQIFCKQINMIITISFVLLIISPFFLSYFLLQFWFLNLSFDIVDFPSWKWIVVYLYLIYFSIYASPYIVLFIFKFNIFFDKQTFSQMLDIF